MTVKNDGGAAGGVGGVGGEASPASGAAGSGEQPSSLLGGGQDVGQGGGVNADQPAKDADNKDAARKESGGKEKGGKENGEGAGGAPETYGDFTLPDGMAADSGLLEQATPLFRELGLNQDQAQKLVSFWATHQAATAEAQRAAATQQATQWLRDMQADPVLGGAKFAQNTGVAFRAVERFGSPALKELLNQSGLGNHPELVRFAFNVGQAMGEDGVLTSGAGGGGAPNALDALYGPKR